MKKLNLLIVAALMGTAAQAQQMPNSNFDNWKSSCGKSYCWSYAGLISGWSQGEVQRPGIEPESWNGSSIKQTYIASVTKELVLETEGETPEDKAVELLNIKPSSLSALIAPAFINFGTPWVYPHTKSDNADGGTYGGMAFANKPDAIKIYCKKSGTTETSHIIVYLWNGTFQSKIGDGTAPTYTVDDADRAIMGKITPDKSGKLIASCDYGFTTTDDSWKEIVVPLDYREGMETETPSKINVILSAADYWTRGNMKVNTRLDISNAEFVYYSTLKSLSYDGVTVPEFAATDEGGTYSVDAFYDAEKLDYTKAAAGGSVETSYDDASAKLTITVKGDDDTNANPNHNVYTIQFNKEAANTETTYTNALEVSVDGATTSPQTQNINVIKKSTGKYDLALNNFSLGSGDEALPVGNILLSDITPTENADGTTSLVTSQQITILPGNDPNVDEEAWLGPFLGEVPIDLTATIDGDNMTCKIDIDMSESIGQVIKVTFAPLLSLNDATAYNTATSGLYCVDMTREFKDSWNTFCCPFSLSAAEAAQLFSSVATFESAEGNVLNFSTTNDKSIEAGVPYLVKKADTYSGHIYAGKDIAPITAGSVAHNYTLTGVFAAGNVASGDYFISDGKFWQSEGSTTIKPYRAYIAGGAGAKALAVSIDGETTAIDGINADGATTVSGDIYTLGGQLVRKNATSTEGLAKGIYLVNGKKTVIK